MSRMTKLGIFGSAQINFQSDWIQILNENTDQVTNSASTGMIWDSNSLTCTHVAGIELQIIYSQLGFLEKPQTYIVAAKARGIYKNWTYKIGASNNPNSVQ